MKTRLGLGGVVAIVLVALTVLTLQWLDAQTPAIGESTRSDAPLQVGSLTVHPCRSHINLSIFPLRGEGSASQAVPLARAVADGTVRILETERIDAVDVRNDGDAPVYVPAGQMLVGGLSDRAVRRACVVPPGAEDVEVAVYSIEEQRWGRRRGDDPARLMPAGGIVPFPSVRQACAEDNNQGEVWRRVAKAQFRLSAAVEGDATDPTCPTSLAGSLRTAEVVRAGSLYVQALRDAVDSPGQTVGIAFAVNGAVREARVFDSPSLLRELWPDLLRAAVVQAVVSRSPQGPSERVDIAQVAEFLRSREEDAPAEGSIVGERYVSIRE